MATVLVVDDRPTNLEIARATLDLGGHRVIEASDGQQALDTARLVHPDIVVTDALMPGMDGFQLLHELRHDPATASIPVLLYTAHYGPDETMPLAAAFGVSSVLSKAADPLDLLDAVADALREQARRPRPADPTELGFGERHLFTVNAKLMEKVRELDESEARFAAMAEASPIGIVLGNPIGLATYVNPRLAEIIHAPTADLLGQGWLQCLHPEHRRELHVGPGHALDLAEDSRRYRERVTLADGQQRWLTVVIRGVRDSEHLMTGFIAMVDDITTVVEIDERNRIEEREREIEARRQVTTRFESLTRLSGGVAHDFNNMLNVILSYGEFARDAVGGASGAVLTEAGAQAIVSDLDKIDRAGQRAARLAHQLLTFGGREVVVPTVVDVNGLITDVRDLIADTIGKHIAVVVRLDAQLRRVRIDAGRLTQILVNLATNARDAMPDGGHLRLETRNADSGTDARLAGLPAGRYVCVTVIDAGEGMSTDTLEQAVEPFFTTKPRGQGDGLGLATSYGVAKQAGGELFLESAPGSGTTVRLYLPATDEPTVPNQHIGAAPGSAGQTILVADDEDGVRSVVTRILTGAGYHVLAAFNGRDALAISDDHPGVIDALLTDVVMPVMNGRELADALGRTRPDTPVLYMSGYAGPLMTEQGLLSPGVTVLGKPFRKAELLKALRLTLINSRPLAG